MEGLKVPVWLALVFMFALGAMSARVFYLQAPALVPKPSPPKGKPNGQIGANPEPLSGDAKGN